LTSRRARRKTGSLNDLGLDQGQRLTRLRTVGVKVPIERYGQRHERLRTHGQRR
jgi:hypothetical protein